MHKKTRFFMQLEHYVHTFHRFSMHMRIESHSLPHHLHLTLPGRRDELFGDVQ